MNILALCPDRHSVHQPITDTIGPYISDQVKYILTWKYQPKINLVYHLSRYDPAIDGGGKHVYLNDLHLKAHSMTS